MWQYHKTSMDHSKIIDTSETYQSTRSCPPTWQPRIRSVTLSRKSSASWRRGEESKGQRMILCIYDGVLWCGRSWWHFGGRTLCWPRLLLGTYYGMAGIWLSIFWCLNLLLAFIILFQMRKGKNDRGDRLEGAARATTPLCLTCVQQLKPDTFPGVLVDMLSAPKSWRHKRCASESCKWNHIMWLKLVYLIRSLCSNYTYGVHTPFVDSTIPIHITSQFLNYIFYTTIWPV